jgi:hypothetical protein
MKRLPSSGCSMVGSGRTDSELQRALVRLGVAEAFDAAAVNQVHFRIARISGAWMANEESKEASSVAKALRVTGENLITAARVLGGKETGFQTTTEIWATFLMTKFLAPDPALKKDPDELISEFRRQAAQIGNACLAAHAELSQKSTRDGRDRFGWYDDFTALLLEIAQRANIAPTLGNDPINDRPCGWLLQAAQELELFLDPSMRSPSVVACGKRLARGLKRLGHAQGQNPRPAA